MATQVLSAIGIAFALTGLVTTILRNALALWCLAKPCQHAVTRLLVSDLQVVRSRIRQNSTRALSQSTRDISFHYTVLSQHLDGGWLTEERLRLLASSLFAEGSGPDDARLRALLEMGTVLKQQITLLSISDGFTLIGLSATVCMLLLSFLTYAPPLVARTKKVTA